MKLFLITILSVFTYGCATATYTPPNEGNNLESKIVINKNYDKTWNAIINHLSSSYFAIDNFEKDSGLITVSFGADNPTDFIDCGNIKVKWTDQNYNQHNFNGPYVNFLKQEYGADLAGKMNITARSIGDSKTAVRVNARYIFTANPNVWSFDTGATATENVKAIRGTDSTRTCKPTLKAENSILTAVNHLAE